MNGGCNMQIDYVALGQKIRSERQKHNLSQDKLAELCNISTAFLGHIERGSRKMSLETLVTLANALNISIDYLLLDDLTESNAILSAITSQIANAPADKEKQFMNIVKILSQNIDKL